MSCFSFGSAEEATMYLSDAHGQIGTEEDQWSQRIQRERVSICSCRGGSGCGFNFD